MNIDRFHNSYTKDASGCWLWDRATFGGGYGWFFVSKTGGKRVGEYAHRASWKIHRGAIPEGLHVLHKCDVRTCVNPDHLFLGTNLDNINDRLSKSRPKTGTAGERHPKAKLTEEQVKRIKGFFGKRTVSSIAKEFGLSESAVSSIKIGRSWANV
jgi:hypothetical protein